MSGIILLLSLSALLGVGLSERIRYDNYQVFEVIPNTDNQLKTLRDLDGSSDSLIFLEGLGFAGRKSNVVVAPHKQPDFIAMLNNTGIFYNLVEQDLQQTLDMENAGRARSAAGQYDWTSYHTLDETYQWLDVLAAKYPGKVELVTAGKTYEGREIRGVKVSFKEGNKGVFIEGGIHAREWISPATVTYILHELLTSSETNVREMAENFDWYIFPNVNPDGYVYTYTRDRLWRKTRSPQGNCYGADPNRNWDFHWNEIGASSNPCADNFAGSAPFSEIEIRSLSKYIESLKGKIHTYLSFHAYSQLLLFPYGHTRERTPNHNDMQQVGDAAAKALASRYGTIYKVGNIYDAIYPAAGASIDWAYGVLNIPLSYTYELRPSGSSWNGFVLPANQIIPTGQETLDSLVALLGEAKKLGYYQ